MSALERLVERAPPPERRSWSVDWAHARRELGLVLPQDYMTLADTYGPGIFAGTIELFVPGAANQHLDLVARTSEMREIIAMLQDSDAYDDDDGSSPDDLVAWGNGPDVEFLTWITAGDADRWPVALLDTEDLRRWTFANTATETLLGLLDGTLDQPLMDARGHGFASYA